MTQTRKKIWIAAGIAVMAVVGLICYIAVDTTWDEVIQVVETERGETITFNILREYSDGPFYQSGLENLSEEDYKAAFPGEEGLGPYDLDWPDDLGNVKHQYQFFRDTDLSRRFHGEAYQWEVHEQEPYQNPPDLLVALDRSEPVEAKTDRGYVLVELYPSRENFGPTENLFLIQSEVNGKKVIAKTLKDYYYSNRKSYRIWIDKVGGADITALVIADNVGEDYVVNLIEFLAGAEGASL